VTPLISENLGRGINTQKKRNGSEPKKGHAKPQVAKDLALWGKGIGKRKVGSWKILSALILKEEQISKKKKGIVLHWCRFSKLIGGGAKKIQNGKKHPTHGHKT